MPNQLPKVGAVEDGWRFKGGNPADQSSWEKAYSESQAVAGRPVVQAPTTRGSQMDAPLRLASRVQQAIAPSEFTGTQSSPEEDASTAGLSATALGAVMDPMATARGIAGGMAGAYGGGHVGRYLGGKQMGDAGETIGKAVGGLTGGYMGYRGMPLKAKVAGLPIELGGMGAKDAAREAAMSSASPSPTPDVEGGYRQAGLYTPRSSAQETSMWHAGQGGATSPYEAKVGSLIEQMRAAPTADQLDRMSPQERQSYFIRDAMRRGVGRPSFQGTDPFIPESK